MKGLTKPPLLWSKKEYVDLANSNDGITFSPILQGMLVTGTQSAFLSERGASTQQCEGGKLGRPREGFPGKCIRDLVYCYCFVTVSSRDELRASAQEASPTEEWYVRKGPLRKKQLLD